MTKQAPKLIDAEFVKFPEGYDLVQPEQDLEGHPTDPGQSTQGYVDDLSHNTTRNTEIERDLRDFVKG